MIKPQFFKHSELYEAERATGMPLRVAFAGLWTVADRAGRFRWKVDLKPDILPYDPVDMLAVLDALERHGFVQRYVVAGKEYGLIPSFADHQTFHHTERASTLPAPCVNGEPTVKELADTATGTGTVAGTELEDAASAALGVSVPSEPELTALFLTICANQAVTERWGESTRPYTQGSAASLYDVLRNAGVPPEVARLSFYRQCRESKQAAPPRGINYFRAGIEEDWAIEQTRRAAIANLIEPPSTEETTRRPPRRATAPSDAGDSRGRGARYFGQIRELVETTQQPGQAERRYIPRAKVAALGDDVLRAYESVGGADRFLAANGNELGFLLRDFTQALESVHVHA